MFTLTQFLPPLFKLPQPATAESPQDGFDKVERLLEDHQLPREEPACSGGYNEAFIVEHWARYTR